MWVAVELFTMGNLHAVYKNLLTKFRKSIAKQYNTGETQLSSWIENLTYIRNHLAHYMRIYDYNFGRTPSKCNKHHTYKKSTNLIFDQIYVMSFMYSDKEEWNNYVLPEIKTLLAEYEGAISLERLGFPPDWYKILKA